jgi:uncharacterized membrane protein HdeD (DUF308 family)
MKKRLSLLNLRKMEIIRRLKAPTPRFFRVLRNVGLALASAGGVLLATPIALPVIVTTLAGYITLAGGVLSAVSQTAVDGETDYNPNSDDNTK